MSEGLYSPRICLTKRNVANNLTRWGYKYSHVDPEDGKWGLYTVPEGKTHDIV